MKLIAFLHPTPTCIYDRGTHNGYVAVPPEHPYYGVDYDDVPVEIHGGLTFGSLAKDIYDWDDVEYIDNTTSIPNDYWVFGFDTCHFGDSPEEWDENSVTQETLFLKKQLEELATTKTK